MNTKNILLVGAGVLVGYLLAGYYLKIKSNAQAELDAKNLLAEKAKQENIDACNKEVADFMATAKFKSGVDLDKIKKDKFDACMATKA
jgi:outer membrane murein-binding lipoprotein Lpp